MCVCVCGTGYCPGDGSRHTRDPRGLVDSVAAREFFLSFLLFCFSSTHLPGQEIAMSWRLS